MSELLALEKVTAGYGDSVVLEDVSLAMEEGDSLALLGRNGAGKTSLLRVIGGENEPFAGTVIRKGGFGYLPQDPRIAGVLDGRSAVEHILSGRGIDDEMARIEKLRIAMEEHPDERAKLRVERAPRDQPLQPGMVAVHGPEATPDGARRRRAECSPRPSR